MLRLNEFTDGQDKETALSPLEYMLFKSVEAGYMVEFLKNPLPWDKKVDLPYCGFTKNPTKRDTSMVHEELDKRGPLFGNPLQAVPSVFTPPVVEKFNQALGKLIKDGGASVGRCHQGSRQCAGCNVSRTNGHRSATHQQTPSQGSPATIVSAAEYHSTHSLHCIHDKLDDFGSR